MKKLLLFLTLLSSVMAWSQQGLVSGELNVTSIPSSQGGGTFELVGTFSDPKGLYFAADVDTTVDTATVALWKGNNYYTITAAAASGSTLTLTVTDTYNTGFLPTGIYSIGQETPNLRLPGVSTTGDSNPALATPPDAAAKMNYILLRIDEQIAAQLAAAGNGMFSLENQDSTWKVSRYNIDQRIEGFLRDKGQFQLVDSAGGSGLLLDVTAGADNNLAGYVQLGNGVHTPLFLLEGEGETGNDRAIKLGMGDSLYRMPLVSPGAAGLPEGMYVMLWDSAGMNAGTLGWLDISTLSSGGATSNYYYVSKSKGDNATAVAGDPTKPWSDPWAAVAAASSGAMIYVTDGRWTITRTGALVPGEIEVDSINYDLARYDVTNFYFAPNAGIKQLSLEHAGGAFTNYLFHVDTLEEVNVYGHGVFEVEVYNAERLIQNSHKSKTYLQADTLNMIKLEGRQYKTTVRTLGGDSLYFAMDIGTLINGKNYFVHANGGSAGINNSVFTFKVRDVFLDDRSFTFYFRNNFDTTAVSVAVQNVYSNNADWPFIELYQPKLVNCAFDFNINNFQSKGEIGNYGVVFSEREGFIRNSVVNYTVGSLTGPERLLWLKHDHLASREQESNGLLSVNYHVLNTSQNASRAVIDATRTDSLNVFLNGNIYSKGLAPPVRLTYGGNKNLTLSGAIKSDSTSALVLSGTYNSSTDSIKFRNLEVQSPIPVSADAGDKVFGCSSIVNSAGNLEIEQLCGSSPDQWLKTELETGNDIDISLNGPTYPRLVIDGLRELRLGDGDGNGNIHGSYLEIDNTGRVRLGDVDYYSHAHFLQMGASGVVLGDGDDWDHGSILQISNTGDVLLGDAPYSSHGMGLIMNNNSSGTASLGDVFFNSHGYYYAVSGNGPVISGPTQFIDQATVNGAFEANSGGTFNGPLEVNDASTFNGNIDVYGVVGIYDSLSMFANIRTVANVILENLQGPPGIRNLGINGDGRIVVSADTLTLSIDAVPSTETLTQGETAGFWTVPDHLVGAELLEVQYAFRTASTAGGNVDVQLTDTFVGFAGATLSIGDRVSTQDLSGAPITLTSEQIIQPLVASMAVGADPEGLVVNLKIVKP